MSGTSGTTEILLKNGRAQALRVEKFALTPMGGTTPGARTVIESREAVIGTAPGADLKLDDRLVSRHHAAVRVTEEGFLLEDLDSTNGTFVDGLRIRGAYLKHGCTVQVGSTRVRFERLGERFEIPLSEGSAFGRILGQSMAMRELFAQLERLAASDVPIVLHGESGTGKELVAEELHRLGPRAKEPFVVFDCAAVPPNLVESELFGHVKGAFTGAVSERAGAIEEADGGTLLLDEIGDLRPELQPHLLRALERGQVRRVGSNQYRTVKVRILAATHRDLRAEVARGSFREDLYYRLMVVKLRIPALRERADDVPLLVQHFVEEAAARRGLDPGALLGAFGPQTMQALQNHPWPGNVRELRNFVERTIALADLAPAVPSDMHPGAGGGDGGAAGAAGDENDDATGGTGGEGGELPSAEQLMPFKDARARAVDRFERTYLRALMRRADGVISRAAREAGMDRTQLQRLLTRYDLRPKREAR
jgi:DNA-binding NtrC family response regulator